MTLKEILEIERKINAFLLIHKESTKNNNDFMKLKALDAINYEMSKLEKVETILENVALS